MKYLFLKFFSQSEDRFPVIVDLRKLELSKDGKLTRQIMEQMLLPSAIPEEAFRRLCDLGKFIFLFDGYDEIPVADRSLAERQILKFARSSPRSGFAISGRDTKEFLSWEGFEIYDMAPLSKEKVQAFVDKSKFRAGLKKDFLRDYHETLLPKLGSLVSTPLLLTLLLMTYSQYGRLPERVSSFYVRAFETLLIWHDATKESFTRQMLLQPEDFRVFFPYSAFTHISVPDLNLTRPNSWKQLKNPWFSAQLCHAKTFEILIPRTIISWHTIYASPQIFS